MRLFTLLALLLIVTASPQLMARNIMTEQNEAAAARDANRDARLKLEEVQKRISNQQQVVQREQDRLKEMQNEEAQVRKEIDRTQAIYDQKAKELDKAWQQRKEY
ncbi:hypothetical protein [Methylophilus aquaticus]|uniref:Uncharacterized protein n=1 Tax=Methylophilus aquaticus TaxID=1971610 RepID=A0ABT9JVU6_9PROT|nr:hypothetical protein [Methylophilus aquaticus]MDP8568698.1 hypothetical protein [Methylophilus aquaticus]